MVDERKDWTEMVRPIVEKCEVGAAFGQRVYFTAEGAHALGKLLKKMATHLDSAFTIVTD
ncbi:MAG: hypothetical protein KGL39_23825 [Patescibacteria group bacterium]|nr:hypothetical protein [Patescibacteria group bacterium]